MSRRFRIILPCRDEGPWVRVTVDSILETTRSSNFDILVFANGDLATDLSFASRAGYRDRVTVRSCRTPLGVGESVNRAVADGDATYYAVLDSHCLVDQADWLERALDTLERIPNASMVQPEVVQFTHDEAISATSQLNPDDIEVCYRAYSIIWRWPYEGPFSFASVVTRAEDETAYESMAGGGMASFLRSETFHRLGRYDPEVLGWYPETMDYCVRAWMLGFPMVVDPTIRVYHRIKPVAPDELQDDSPDERTTHVAHGVLRTAYKYFSPRRREIAENVLRHRVLEPELGRLLEVVRRGRWLEERVDFLRNRRIDDDQLFERFRVDEQRFAVRCSS